ncbi:hypothetical protein RhiirC2_869259 [Rhizophagus irregularis]|uniref:Uncharacterized protein n=1 Tax=Rhizophagus irregularis TaxID=588596 RepID=A0A2N1MS91_9GLOM|nr:hypothetical protein RhiirC2_869259 [Rhizophagus irregularis]
MESAYKFTEYRYRFLKETKNIFSANSRTTAKSQEREPRDGGLSKTEQNFLESIRNDTVCRKEMIKDIVLKCSATSFDVYIDEIKRLSWENSKLREELRRKDHVMDRKVNEEKHQARIISQKNEQIRKISQEVEKTRSELKKYQESTYDGSVIDKLKEVQDIFNQTSNEMEWKKINEEALGEVRMEFGINTSAEARKWIMEENNYFYIGRKIISLAEKTKIFQEYTTLNDNFKQRLENENRYQDEKKIGEKRPILESPSVRSDLEAESDEEPGRIEIDQPLIFTLRTEEEEDKEVVTEASPSEKNGGKKKKKKNNKKK